MRSVCKGVYINIQGCVDPLSLAPTDRAIL